MNRTPQLEASLAEVENLYPRSARAGLKRFVELIKPPEDLVAFDQVAARLSVIAEALPEDASREAARRVDDLVRTANRIVRTARRAKMHFKPHRSKKAQPVTRDIRFPFDKVLSEHPLYCQLGFPRPSEVDEAIDLALARLQAHLLVVVIEFDRRYPDTRIDSPVRKVCEAIREFPVYTETHTFLRRMALWDNSLSEFFQRLAEQLERESYSRIPTIVKTQQNIGLLHEYLDGRKVRRGGGGHGKGVHPTEDRPLDEDPDDERPQLGLTFEPTEVHQTPGNRARRQAGAPGDDQRRPVRARPSQPVRPGKGESFAQQMRAKRGMRQTQAARHQRLPQSMERLTPAQLVPVFRDLGDLWNPVSNPPKTREHAFRTLVEVMFFTGSKADQVLGTHVIRSLDDLPREITPQQENSRFYYPDEGLWIVPAPRLPSQRRVDLAWAEDMRSVDQVVLLPLPPRVIELIDTLMPDLQFNRQRYLFADASVREALPGLLKERIRRWNREIPDRGLTERRLSLHMLLTLYDRSSDLAEAARMTGRVRAVEYDTPLYYHAPWQRSLAREYVDACAQQADRLGLDLAGSTRKYRKKIARLAAVPENRAVGSEACPRPEVIHTTVERFVHTVRQARRGITADAVRLFRFHNLLTTYVTAMVMWATGHRVVTGVIFDPAQQAGEFLLINDKVGAGGGEPRLVWLPSLVRQQLAFYAHHARELVARRLAFEPSWFRDRFPSTANPWKPVTPAQGFLFYIIRPRRNPQCIQVRPSRFEGYIRRVTPWPTNVHRHFLRTHLRESGVPGEIVDAFMGHAQLGCEAFGRHSSLSPADITRHTGPLIEDWMTNAGWRPVAGLGDGP